jgi:isopentenyl phosphate kinase
MNNLIFLKLGGSLITDKDQARSARFQLISQLAGEIRQALDQQPNLKLLIGHGSGSFGHYSANRHKTIEGAHNPSQWLGFTQVWKDARDLNQIMIEALFKANLPIIAFPPSAWVVTDNRQILQTFNSPLTSALDSGLIPVIQGDVIFDQRLGGTILSTEDLFFFLAANLHPRRILLAGIEPGVWESFPDRNHLILKITPGSLQQLDKAISGSSSIDVTGGMQKKVATMLELLAFQPDLKISIFSVLQSGALFSALTGEFPGTTLCNQ